MGLRTKTDQAALEASLVATRAEDAGRAAQIDGMLKDRDWATVAKFCAYCAQSNSLHLQPWQFPPCWIDPRDIDAALRAPDDQRGIPNAARLLQRMQRANVSRFDPDPVRSCEAAERRTATP
jgi:hypothetical protein